jgi:ribose transport system substrate-binding protein
MSKTERHWSYLLLLIVPLLWLGLLNRVMAAAPSPTNTGKATFVVAFAQDTLANDWRMAQVRALQAGFARYPHIRFIYTDAKGSTAKQIQDVEDLLFRGVDILITSPRDSRAMTPVITQAYQKGIPVILLTRKIEGEAYTTFIAPDDAAIARDAARYVADKLGGSGSVLMLQGLPSASTAITRTNAFIDELGKHAGLRLAAIKTANYLRSDAIKAVEEVLQEGRHFDAIYAQSDSMASGARIALKKAGIDLAKLQIVGIDYISEAREAIRNGQQSASFTYPTCADEAVEAVLTITQGKPLPKRIRVLSQRVTRDNVEQVIPIF